MKTNLSFSAPAEVETDCLVAVVLDRGEKDKTDAYVAMDDRSVQQAAAEVLGSEATGKMLETTLLHKPVGMKAKRLLLIGGGKAKKFTSFELRKLAGAAVRGLKAKSLRS